VKHWNILALAGTVADKGNFVADGASQDCRIDHSNRYEYNY